MEVVVRKVLPVLAVLIMTAFSLHAQSNSSSDKAQAAGKSDDLTTLAGCLQMSMGHYTLTEDDATINELSGGGRKLHKLVGHQVEVTGKPGNRTIDTTQPGGASSTVEQPVFDVKAVKDIAEKCTSGS